jgi:hypothetical protein
VLKNAELDALEADMDFELNSVPSFLQPGKEYMIYIASSICLLCQAVMQDP